MIGILKKILGDKVAKDKKLYAPLIQETNKYYQEYDNLTDDEIRELSRSFKKQIADAIAPFEKEIEDLEKKAEGLKLKEREDVYEEIDGIKEQIDKNIESVLKDIEAKAFAVVKQTAKRWTENQELVVTASDVDRAIAAKNNNVVIEGDKAIWKNTWEAGGNEVKWGMTHYDVQIMGGGVIHDGKIAEMQTGEGKTLVATFPVYLNALAGKGVHVVTVNDYLAKRDAAWMGPLYQFHELSVDVIDSHQPNSEERRQAYLADITFGTNNEFGFDYLRDNMVQDPGQLVQRKHHFAIIDEVDSILIDDARTPLIISGPMAKGDDHEYVELRPKVEKLYSAQRKLVTDLITQAKKGLNALGSEDEKAQKDAIKEASDALLRAHRGLPKSKPLIKYLSEPGIKTQLQKTENFYLQEQSKHMPFIDEELYFTIEEKTNQINLTDKGIDLISKGENDGYYILPDVSAMIAEIEKGGMSKEEELEKKEALVDDYSLKSERIHSINQLLKAYAMFEKEVDYVIMDGKVKIVDDKTGRIMEGRRYSDGLHMAIEAKENVKVEAATQTYATISLQNYFRMYHKLAGMTGTAETEAQELWDIYKLDVVVIPTNKPIQRKDDEDLVYKTAREKYNAISEEVEKLSKAGRPVLVGTTTVEISELLSRMLKMRGIEHSVLNAKYHAKEAEIVRNAGLPGAVTIATNMAGRGTDIKLGEGVKEAGGLAIIGTERHDSRRVDRQLRGRAGRQGDPGSSQFFVSLEDHLMRLFASGRISGIMDKLGLKEGEVIQHSMITKSIERAQKKVEENNFGIRKRLLEYDDVMNMQRRAIYKKRKNALFGDRLDMDIANMYIELLDDLVERTKATRDYATFELELIRMFGFSAPMNEDEFLSTEVRDIVTQCYKGIRSATDDKFNKIGQVIHPMVQRVNSDPSNQYKNMGLRYTDGQKTLSATIGLEEAETQPGEAVKSGIEKGITLAVLDNEWKHHLRDLDDLRQTSANAVHEQKDPLLIYKLESFELFKKMLLKVNDEVVTFLSRGDLFDDSQLQAPVQRKAQSNVQTGRGGQSGDVQSEGYAEALRGSQQQSAQQSQVKVQPVVREDKKVGRNDPCPCGSGKKYKQCHGK